MDVPGRWRPLKIDGTFAGGTMTLGRGADVVMQVKWWRPAQDRFRPERWLDRRLRSLKATRDEEATCPSPDGFELVMRATSRAPKRGKGGPLALWYGWAGRAGVQIEAVVGPQASGGRSAPWHALRSLRAAEKDAPTTWAAFGCLFHVPAGFVVDRHELLLGDLSLQFAGPRGQTLMLRQIYPADLALERRKIADWLEFSRFPTRRCFRGDCNENWAIEHDGRRLAGLCRTGAKCYAFPLGVVRPRWSLGAAVHDCRAGRLLVAEHDSARPIDDALLRRTILAMNQGEEVA